MLQYSTCSAPNTQHAFRGCLGQLWIDTLWRIAPSTAQPRCTTNSGVRHYLQISNLMCLCSVIPCMPLLLAVHAFFAVWLVRGSLRAHRPRHWTAANSWIVSIGRAHV